MTRPDGTLRGTPEAPGGQDEERRLLLGRLAGGTEAFLSRNDDGGWGVAVEAPGASSMAQTRPVRFEVLGEDGEVSELAGDYESVGLEGEAVLARGRLEAAPGVVLDVEDRWQVAGPVLDLSRIVTVSGEAAGGFLSGISLLSEEALSLADLDPFAPGMIYGFTDHITGVAIGGKENYAAGVRQLRIREDRLPAPLFGLHFRDGTSVAALDAAPDGSTTAAESQEVEPGETRVDPRLGFAALGGYEQDGRIAVGFWSPGTEGEVTYRGDDFPGGQVRRWRPRYHPIRAGGIQRYRLKFRFGRYERFPDFYRAAWRWAWDELRPETHSQDIEAARRSLTEMLAGLVVRAKGKAGVPHFRDASSGEPGPRRRSESVMGFTGRGLESGYFLLREGLREEARGDVGGERRYRELGTAILDSFAGLETSPPEGEGFDLATGEPSSHTPHNSVAGRVYLRALCEGGKYMLRAWRCEADRGRDHEIWRRFGEGLGEWLLAQQRPDGGFPRSWVRGTGEVADGASESSYNAIPFLAQLHQITGEAHYLDAALRTGEFCWATGQNEGWFVGGTIDNPNVVDKEAGTISLEAHLRLYEATGDERWLRRARAAADFAETWVYLWDVPMPEDADDADLHWKKGVPSTGLQLIATGHSLVDAYMAWDVAEYARLASYTGDDHYLEVAGILLHNTKSMLALPGRTFDLAGPGWQQEHWSLAPRRGYGIHRGWLPWITCSHLEGIYGLEDFDPGLFARLSTGATGG